MPRVKRGNKRRLKRKKVLDQAKGYYQGKSKLYRYAKEAVDRGNKFAYIGRKRKKRDFRSLWIIRINAAARNNGLSYSRLIHGLSNAGVEINRKMLAEVAVSDPEGFTQLAEKAKAALANGAPPGADDIPVATDAPPPAVSSGELAAIDDEPIPAEEAE